ncbi:MAG: hypothetical protein CVU65_09680 [Deltaproteobacteria bacterium HGW-Deltaproteobacteria-22]|jgi:phosphatidylglycerol:prolipoprotein diacylglycerol transferase|nr:MAG: hypothetical protein CVU65_09680 [Deltaproteobacteria bacterium HGW-Deltaproteobacteria-22]
MKPVLLEFNLPLFGHITFPAYFTMLALAFLVGLWLLERAGRRLRIHPLKLYDMGVLIMVFALFGSRFLHVLADGQFIDYVHLCTDPKQVEVPMGPGGPATEHCTTDASCGEGFLCNGDNQKCYPPRDCLSVFKVWKGGLVFYGGFIFAAGFAFWYIRRHRLPFWKIGDVFGYILPLGLFLGRTGCLLNGCCYGAPSHTPWSVRYGPWLGPWEDHLKAGLIGPGAPHSLHVHPTQLYSAAINLLIFLVLYFWLYPRKKWDGQVLGAFLLAYAVGRFTVEAFRADPRGALLGMSTSQLISVVMFGIGAWIFARRPGARGPQDPEPPAVTPGAEAVP